MMTNDIDLSLREAIGLRSKEHVFILTDRNANACCLPIIQSTLHLPDSQVLCLDSGEESKNVDGLQTIWDFLLHHDATRQSILLILGGGSLMDLGGLAATTYMRGIAYVNIPTTLLAMVDAAQGGKTGINYAGYKNLIGTFSEPDRIIEYIPFIKTLPANQFLSGWAEMLKHTLISSPLQLAQWRSFDLNKWFSSPSEELLLQLRDLVERSIEIKRYIVEADPREVNMRQTLNFGHTVGHALEAFSQKTDKPLLHGYAVLYGMVAELYLSHLRFSFPEHQLQQVVSYMKEFYGKPVCSCRDYDELLTLMHHDKKNRKSNDITFTLLHSIGNYRLGCVCSETEIKEALDFLFNC